MISGDVAMAGRSARKPRGEALPLVRPTEAGHLDREPVRPAARPPSGPVSDPLRLAAEVDRLQAELDVMRRRLAEFEASAERDPLTGVFNRRGFDRELTRAVAYLDRYPARAALVYLDLDRFKPVNDTYGHAAGDAVLVATTASLARHVRASDSVGRLGGDEFAILLWNLGPAEARAKADALEAAIAAVAIDCHGAAVSVGASAGVATLSAGDTLGDIIARADAAMYARKDSRRR
jgi:diguanylate cyclase (GGDEF)-like protein